MTFDLEQKKIFLSSEGDQYFHRNREAYDSLDNGDELVELLKYIELNPGKILEVGCSNGVRLNNLKKQFPESRCYGIDPSSEAILAGSELFQDLSLSVGTADNLNFDNNSFNTIIFGFCLYLCDRNDLFKIAYEADRCLRDGGIILIKDFYPSYPYMNQYCYNDGVYSYKIDYPSMFKWNPAYNEIASIVFTHRGFDGIDNPDERVALTVIKKNEMAAYIKDPFKAP